VESNERLCAAPYLFSFAVMITRGTYFGPVPFVSTARTTVAQFIGVCLAKFQAPLPNREHDASLCHEFFDGANTEREAEIQPDAVADDFRWDQKYASTSLAAAVSRRRGKKSLSRPMSLSEAVVTINSAASIRRFARTW
jgi:hypothetical protein